MSGRFGEDREWKEGVLMSTSSLWWGAWWRVGQKDGDPAVVLSSLWKLQRMFFSCQFLSSDCLDPPTRQRKKRESAMRFMVFFFPFVSLHLKVIAVARAFKKLSINIVSIACRGSDVSNRKKPVEKAQGEAT